MAIGTGKISWCEQCPRPGAGCSTRAVVLGKYENFVQSILQSGKWQEMMDVQDFQLWAAELVCVICCRSCSTDQSMVESVIVAEPGASVSEMQ